MSKTTPQTPYRQWVIIAPPATRFYQQADGNIGLYFHKDQAGKMVEWAEENLRRFMYFAAQLQTTEPQAQKPQGLPVRNLASPPVVNPTGIKTEFPNPSKELAEQVSKPRFNHDGAPIPDEPPPEALPPVDKTTVTPVDLSADPGMLIALKQQEQLDFLRGINRKAKNEAPEEEETPSTEATNSDTTTEPEVPPEQTQTEVPPVNPVTGELAPKPGEIRTISGTQFKRNAQNTAWIPLDMPDDAAHAGDKK